MNSPLKVETLRAVSKIAYGHTYRLELMLAILDVDDGICTLSDLSQTLGITVSSLQKPFEALIDLGLITALADGESKYRHFIRNDDIGWKWARHLAERAK